jgi:uncharacterized membrane protein YkvI
MRSSPTIFQRIFLPGLAFKAAVIGGGYATGRELAEFFLPSGPRGGLLAMALAMVIWSMVCTLTFQLAFVRRSYDYRSFFQSLLGRYWVTFEIVYVAFIVVLLSVFGAAAGAIGTETLGWPAIGGTLCLVGCITLFAAFGNQSVDRVFKYVSFILYGTYALFLVLSVARFGGRIAEHLALAIPTDGWVTGGITYASYNVVGAVIILPAIRHLTSRRDGIIAGILAGPLAMLPAMIFFLCMAAFYPEIQNAVLPSNFMLARIGIPLFQLLFQGMIFAALVECGTGAVHAINERIAVGYRHRTGRDLSKRARSGVILAMLILSIFVANRFGLVALIAKGYRAVAYLILAVYIVPLFLLAPRLLGAAASSLNQARASR